MKCSIFLYPWNIFGLLMSLAQGTVVEAVGQSARRNLDPADTMKM